MKEKDGLFSMRTIVIDGNFYAVGRGDIKHKFPRYQTFFILCAWKQKRDCAMIDIDKRRIEGAGKRMQIQIRNAKKEEYKAVEALMEQVQQMHISWRPDIYQFSETVLPYEMFEQAVADHAAFVAECDGHVAGIMLVMYRHIENPVQVTRNIIFIDSMAVDEAYRGKGIGHAFFDFLKKLKEQREYDGIELQVNAKNEAAYKMYTDYGFTNKSINMELL